MCIEMCYYCGCVFSRYCADEDPRFAHLVPGVLRQVVVCRWCKV